MNTLLYDGSFEGLLTAVFEVFEYKFSEAEIIARPHFVVSTLFSEPHEVVTNEEKAQRVLKKIQENLGDKGVSKLMQVYFSEDKNAGNLVLEVVRNMLQFPTRNVFGNLANPAILRVRELLKSVSRESHRMKAFVRFEQLKDGVYFAKIAPDFNVLPLIFRHFKERYKDQQWIIYDETRKYGIFYDLENAEFFEPNEDFSKNVAKNKDFHSEKEENYQKLWQRYFEKATIKERKNTKLHLQYLPKRYWKYLTEKRQD